MIRGIVDGGLVDRGDARAVGFVASDGEGSHAAAVPAGADGGLRGVVPRRPAGSERRKTGWSRAEAAGDPGPWRQQAILGRGQWDADALRDIVRDYALETLADADAVLVIDETGFLKQGKASCAVGRQYTRSAGKITNCQVGVFAAYASRHGHAFVDRTLYLPKAWTDDPARMAAAHVPGELRFATKPKLAVAMIERAIRLRRARHALLFSPGAERAVGVGAEHVAFAGSPQCHLDVSGTVDCVGGDPGEGHLSGDRLRAAGDRLDPPVGRRGHQGRAAARLALSRTRRPRRRECDGPPGSWTRGLLVRRHVADGSMAFFSTWCPLGTSLETLVAAEGRRWTIEDAFKTAKNELGLDHNETRSWHGWHRHVSLVMTAFAMLAAIRHHANATTPPPPKRSATTVRPRRP